MLGSSCHFCFSFFFMIFPSLACWNVSGLMITGRIWDWFCLIRDHKLDFLCLLETKTHSPSYSNFHKSKTLALFPFEENYDNFDSSPSGRILLKWNSSIFAFTPSFTLPKSFMGKLPWLMSSFSVYHVFMLTIRSKIDVFFGILCVS